MILNIYIKLKITYALKYLRLRNKTQYMTQYMHIVLNHTIYYTIVES